MLIVSKKFERTKSSSKINPQKWFQTTKRYEKLQNPTTVFPLQIRAIFLRTDPAILAHCTETCFQPVRRRGVQGDWRANKVHSCYHDFSTFYCGFSSMRRRGWRNLESRKWPQVFCSWIRTKIDCVFEQKIKGNFGKNRATKLGKYF